MPSKPIKERTASEVVLTISPNENVCGLKNGRVENSVPSPVPASSALTARAINQTSETPIIAFVK